MSYKRCCVPGCSRTGGPESILHEFPNPEKDLDRFTTWIHSVGLDIFKSSNEFIYKNRRVCRIHFETKYHCRNNRLSRIAVPTLNLACVNSSDSEQTPTKQSQNLLEDLPSPVSTTLTTAKLSDQDPLKQIQNVPVKKQSPLSKYALMTDKIKCP